VLFLSVPRFFITSPHASSFERGCFPPRIMKIEQPTPIQWQFAQRAEQLQSSVIREILKITQRPDIISFAGGLPSPLTFPVAHMQEAFERVLSQQGKVALQYGPT